MGTSKIVGEVVDTYEIGVEMYFDGNGAKNSGEKFNWTGFVSQCPRPRYASFLSVQLGAQKL